MSSSLLVSSINEKSFDDYIDNVVNIYRLSSKSSSIIGNIHIGGKQSKATLSILDSQTGISKKFTDLVFKHGDSFHEKFIKELVRRMNSDCHVSVNDLVTQEDNQKVTYRMIMQNNDMFTIEGLDKQSAQNIIASYNGEKNCKPIVLKRSSNLGEGNYLIFITMLVIVILTLMFVYILIK